jgi:hypothetical protein
MTMMIEEEQITFKLRTLAKRATDDNNAMMR